MNDLCTNIRCADAYFHISKCLCLWWRAGKSDIFHCKLFSPFISLPVKLSLSLFSYILGMESLSLSLTHTHTHTHTKANKHTHLQTHRCKHKYTHYVYKLNTHTICIYIYIHTHTHILSSSIFITHTHTLDACTQTYYTCIQSYTRHWTKLNWLCHDILSRCDPKNRYQWLHPSPSPLCLSSSPCQFLPLTSSPLPSLHLSNSSSF